MSKNIDILEHILLYCEDINESVKRFGKDKDIFSSDKDYRNTVSMSLLQIGELAGHLTDEFRAETKDDMNWAAIRGMRNLFAHNYNAMDIDRIWETVQNDIPMVKDFCEAVITSYRMLEQEAQIPQLEDEEDLEL